MRAVFASSQGADYFVQVPGMFHVNLTDVPYWSPILPWLRITGPIDAERAHNIINAYSLAFFNRHLLNRAEALIDGSASQYPEKVLLIRFPNFFLLVFARRRSAVSSDAEPALVLVAVAK